MCHVGRREGVWVIYREGAWIIGRVRCGGLFLQHKSFDHLWSVPSECSKLSVFVLFTLFIESTA